MQNLALPPGAEPESMDQLRGDCARMAPHWSNPFPAPARARESGAPAPYEALHGVRVPVASARLLDGMSEYGD
ncbi:MAG: hypothetical protein ACRDP3_11165 [Streptomyces sp.]|uniref:hypothetical protein n=1 Tax=Streptomyces sp. TaxID=1931 RepID=UPI003D6B00FF